MDKYYRMSKSAFLEIHRRQQLIGLTVKDFCAQEGFSKTSYYHWRSQFGLTDRSTVSDPVPPEKRMIPIEVKDTEGKSFKEASIATPSSPESSYSEGITMKLPNNVSFHFDGDSCKIAVGIINKVLDHVLS